MKVAGNSPALSSWLYHHGNRYKVAPYSPSYRVNLYNNNLSSVVCRNAVRLCMSDHIGHVIWFLSADSLGPLPLRGVMRGLPYQNLLLLYIKKAYLSPLLLYIEKACPFGRGGDGYVLPLIFVHVV